MVDVSLPLNMPFSPVIKVCGVGGAGCNAVNNMIDSGLQGVDFIAANTDAQALERSKCENKIQLGVKLTRGLGAGAHPEVGELAAAESKDFMLPHVADANMIFVTAGMGGGTGTGAGPMIAKYIKSLGEENKVSTISEMGIDSEPSASESIIAAQRDVLVVGVVTTPFDFEGARRMEIAKRGIKRMSKYVDTLIVIPNQNLFRIVNENTTAPQAFKKADAVMTDAVGGVSGIIKNPALINVDFADIRTVMAEMGKAMFGIGVASGVNRALAAAESAIYNPLLDNVSMQGAKGVLVHISGGEDMTLFEIDIVVNRVKEEVSKKANIIFGATFSGESDGTIAVYVVATGIGDEENYSTRKDDTRENSKSILRTQYSSDEEIAEEDEFEVDQKEDLTVDQEVCCKEKGIKEKEFASTIDSNDISIDEETRSVNLTSRPGDRSIFGTKSIDFSSNDVLETPAYLRRKRK